MATNGDVYNSVFGLLSAMRKLGFHDLRGWEFWSAQRNLANRRWRYVQPELSSPEDAVTDLADAVDIM